MRLRDLIALLVVTGVDALTQTPPVLVPLSPVHLNESKDAPLGRPRSIGTDPDGGFYVVDNARSTVLRFTANGAFVRSYGQPGDGPGELRGPTHIAVMNDTLLAVIDRKRQLSFFHRSTGGFVRRVNVSGTPGTIHSRGMDVWVGALNADSRLGALRVNAATGVTEASVALPAVYDAGNPVVAVAYEIHVVPDASHIVVGFAATNYLITLATSKAADTFNIPILKRRGVPPDVNQRMARTTDPREFYEMMSSTTAVDRLRSGTMLIAHVDSYMRPGLSPQAPLGENSFSYKLFVSLVQLPQRRVCADIPVPIAGSQSPSVTVRGDTLFVFDQDPDNDTQPWQIRRFQIREGSCAWQPAASKGAPRRH